MLKRKILRSVLPKKTNGVNYRLNDALNAKKQDYSAENAFYCFWFILFTFPKAVHVRGNRRHAFRLLFCNKARLVGRSD